MGVVEIWRESPEFWRWRYTEPPSPGSDELVLLSNDVYETRQEAVEAATTAYPGVPVLDLERPPGAPPEQPTGGGRVRMRRTLALLGVALALLALRLRRRRKHGSR
ncbi:MAG TPA: hypothetical protein VE776_11070 [Actinomycetota bacterium]|jgi:hypothetical protein|nr:hypothetical protein [Actinomycetota bacterium]